MEEGGVAHAGHDPFLLAALGKGVAHAVADREGTAHAAAQVLGIERFRPAQSIAANIAYHDRIFALAQFIKEAPVRTAGTERRRTGDKQSIGNGLVRESLSKDARCHDIGIEFIDIGNDILAMTVDAGSLDLFFHDRIQLFDDIQSIYFFGKGTDFFNRQRIGEADFQVRRLVSQHFFGVHISHAGSDDADFRIVHFFIVEGGIFRIFLQLFFPFFNDVPALLGNGRHIVEAVPLFDIGNSRDFFPLAQFDQTLGMVHPGRHADHDRRFVFFADFIGRPGHIEAFLRIGRFEHTDFHGLGIAAVILFVLG